MSTATATALDATGFKENGFSARTAKASTGPVSISSGCNCFFNRLVITTDTEYIRKGYEPAG
jgi:hypothetical protein